MGGYRNRGECWKKERIIKKCEGTKFTRVRRGGYLGKTSEGMKESAALVMPAALVVETGPRRRTRQNRRSLVEADKVPTGNMKAG